MNNYIYIFRDIVNEPIFQNEKLLQTLLFCKLVATVTDGRISSTGDYLNTGELQSNLKLHFDYKPYLQTLIDNKQIEPRGENLFVVDFYKEQRTTRGNKVKFPKSILRSEAWNKPELFRLYLYCYLMASYKDEPKNIPIGKTYTIKTQQAGTFFSGRNSIAEKLHEPPTTIRYRLKTLQRYGLIRLTPIFRNFTIITIVHYISAKPTQKNSTEPAKKNWPTVGLPLAHRSSTNGLPLAITNKNKEVLNKYKKNKTYVDFDFLKIIDFKKLEDYTGLTRNKIEDEARTFTSKNPKPTISDFNNHMMTKFT